MTTTPPFGPLPSLFQHLWKSTLLSGVLSILLGALVLFWPGPTLLVAAVLFGVYLLVSGISQVVMAFSLHSSAGGRVLLFISGAASLILAILAFRNFGEGYALLLLAIWIAIGFIFRGVATTATALGEHGMPGRGLNIFFGLVSILAGIIVLAYPFTSLATLVLVVGIWLIIIGVFEVVAAFGIRKGGGDVRDAVHEAISTR